MKSSRALILIVLLALAGASAWSDRAFPDGAKLASASAPATDTDGDDVPDPIDPKSPQPGEDVCPLVAEDADGVADTDGCPDSDASVSASTDQRYTVTVSTAATRTVDIWIQNGNYPADILAHVLAVSTVGACEANLSPAAGDQFLPFTTDEDGDAVEETFYSMLEWEVSLNAGEPRHTLRDYEVLCSSPGEHSFEIQVDVVPIPPVQEEDVLNLRNVRKSFPVVTVIGSGDPDSDGDGFSDLVESYVGTKPAAACSTTSTAGDEQPDASPADFDDGQTVDIIDVLAVRPVFGTTVPPTSLRYDLAPDGNVNIADILTLKPFFNKSCTP